MASSAKKLVNAINAHCDKGNGIYLTSSPGGRYFRAKLISGLSKGEGDYAYITPDFGKTWVLVPDDAIFSDGNWNVPIPGVPTRRR